MKSHRHTHTHTHTHTSRARRDSIQRVFRLGGVSRLPGVICQQVRLRTERTTNTHNGFGTLRVVLKTPGSCLPAPWISSFFAAWETKHNHVVLQRFRKDLMACLTAKCDGGPGGTCVRPKIVVCSAFLTELVLPSTKHRNSLPGFAPSFCAAHLLVISETHFFGLQ